MVSKVTKKTNKTNSKTKTAAKAKAMASDDGKKTFSGGCHCGKIKYELRLNPNDIAASRCNCTFCQKPGLTNFSVADHEKDFKLISPKDKATMGNYQPNVKTVNKWFCQDCGVHVYAEGSYEMEGQKFDFFSVNLGSLNQPQDGVDLSKTKLSYWDGLNYNWKSGQKDQPWSGGLP